MAVGSIFKSDIITEKDILTGVDVRRLSDNSGDTIHPYFTQPLFSEDGRILLVTSNRTGSWQLYNMEVKTGTMVQLTDEPHILFHSPCLDSKRLIAYYWSGNTLKYVNLDNLQTGELYNVPSGFQPSTLSITSDGQFIDFCYSEVLELSSTTGVLYSGMSETLFRRPTSVVMRVNVRDGSAKAVWGEREWISHIITSPIDNDCIVFNHEGHWQLVQRTWVAKPSTFEVWPIIKTKQYYERAGHEIFTKKGRIVTQFGCRETPTSEWKCSDVFVYPDGSGFEKFDYFPGPKPMHVQVDSTEKIGVSDGAFIRKGQKDGNRYMAMIKYEDGHAKQKILCVHDTSWKTQHSHPHPMFTTDDSHVIFDSDREGHTNIYMAEAIWE